MSGGDQVLWLSRWQGDGQLGGDLGGVTWGAKVRVIDILGLV